MISVNFVFLGAGIGAVGTSLYLRDTLRGTTQPNRVTWLLWAIAPLLATAVELRSGVGLRTLTTFVIGFMPLLVFVASFHNPKALWQISTFDYVCGGLSVAATIAWLLTQNSVIGISGAIAADFLAGLPTVRKSWTHPESETVTSYIGAVVNTTILLLTVSRWTTAVVAFPLFIVGMGTIQTILVGGKVGPKWRLRRTPPVLA